MDHDDAIRVSERFDKTIVSAWKIAVSMICNDDDDAIQFSNMYPL